MLCVRYSLPSGQTQLPSTTSAKDEISVAIPLLTLLQNLIALPPGRGTTTFLRLTRRHSYHVGLRAPELGRICSKLRDNIDKLDSLGLRLSTFGGNVDL